MYIAYIICSRARFKPESNKLSGYVVRIGSQLVVPVKQLVADQQRLIFSLCYATHKGKHTIFWLF